MDSFKPHGDESEEAAFNQVKVGAFVGSADYDIAVYGSYLEYNRQLGESWSLDVKLTSLAQSGNDISVFGLSDVFVNANYKATESLTFTGGFKFPLMDGGRSLDGLPLPMDYQASLGTVDLIFGVGYKLERLHFVAALQQPITQNNNAFLSSSYPSTSPLSAVQSTNGFVRAGDVLLRVSYPLELNEKFVFTPSLLPIYHLTEDRFTDELGVEQIIEGSQGLTLNANVYFDYNLDEHNAFQLNIGAPLAVRDARPDGLTRSFVANLEYRMKF